MIRVDLPLWMLLPYLFVIGAIIGSFLNVCVYRLPTHERLRDQLRGLWSPPSRCPRCLTRIRLRDNIPVLGWILLRGRCRVCRRWISFRYPFIEALNGFLFVAVFLCVVPVGFGKQFADSCLYTPPPYGPEFVAGSPIFGPTPLVLLRWLYFMFLVESLLVASLIDFDLRIIPDGTTLPAMAVGVLGAFAIGRTHLVPVWFQDSDLLSSLAPLTGDWFAPFLMGPTVPEWIAAHPHLHGLAVSVAGMAVGAGVVMMVRVIGHWVLKREAMGFGDVILMAAIGAFLGWQPTLMAFFLAPLAALAIVAIGWLFRRDREIPYGPYLSLAALFVLLGWQQVWPSIERIFSLGAFIPVLGVLMCAAMFITLQLTQLLKRIVGISDDDEFEDEGWTAADQLFHDAGERVDRQRCQWVERQWAGVDAGRGSGFERRWRTGNRG